MRPEVVEDRRQERHLGDVGYPQRDRPAAGRRIEPFAPEQILLQLLQVRPRRADDRVRAWRRHDAVGPADEQRVVEGVAQPAEGCHAPTDVGIGYLEGWWVDADRRRLGVGRALVRACEDWARAAGCVELASDAKLDNVAGHLAHRAVGFEETERLVAFRKALGPPAPAAAAPARGGHIADDIPAALPEELVTVLVAGAGARAERIVSRGHASPPGFWYDQPEDEWVIVLSGAARLEIEGAGGIEPVELRAGSFVELPRHTRHRVAWTDPAVNTIWLALFRG
jgi:cupin 2 domain-containing protein